ncbi:PASTA domain-containing protein, partial [Georgenia sp. 10Sc9-8]|nr:PASTA domain-containing protein [Georgenia halotolerans]
PVEVDDFVAALTARSCDERLPDAVAAREQLQRCRRALDPEVLGRRADVEPAAPPAEAERSATAARAVGTDAPTVVTDVPRGNGTVALPIGAIRADGTEHAEARPRRVGRVLAAVLLLLLLLAAGGLWWAQAGPGAFTVTPDVVGATEEEASAELAEQGLTPVVQREHHDTVPEDVVIASDPAPGDQVRRDGSVQLTVSLGVLMVDVPDVVGREEAEARAALDEAGLPIGTVTSEYSDSVP